MALPDSRWRAFADTERKRQEAVMDIWLYGWDWGWMALAILWVFALAAAFYALMYLADRHTRHPR